MGAKKLFFSLAFCCFFTSTFSQDTLTTSVNKKRLSFIVASEAVTYSGIMVGLNELWYKDYPRSGFHFFNDNSQWLQMDKAGHAMTGYFVGKMGMDIMEWSGIGHKKSLWYGGCLGLLFLTSVEMFDGFSQQWGFSWGDQLANMAGTGLLIGQEYLWQEQRLVLKYSAHSSQFAKHRPQVLGGSFAEQLLKDYNGQTYWLSGNVSSFLKEEAKFPVWLNVAIGYSGDAILFGDESTFEEACVAFPTDMACLQHNPSRQYFLSLDIDLTRIKTKSKFFRTAFAVLNFIKVPFPALEINGKDIGFRPFYF